MGLSHTQIFFYLTGGLEEDGFGPKHTLFGSLSSDAPFFLILWDYTSLCGPGEFAAMFKSLSFRRTRVGILI